MAVVIEHEPCYIYHVRDFQEHSQILEALSLNYGALAIIVNNGRRSNSSSHGVFQPFTPLKLSLKRGRSELFYLTDYDCSETGYNFPLPQHFCAVYINELLHHLYRGKEQDVKLFGAYVSTLEAINNQQNIEQSLRLFELTLLESMGYALTLRDDEGILLDKDSHYRFCFGAGFFKVDAEAMNAIIAQEESMRLAAEHNTALPERYTAVSTNAHSVDDSGMMFPKSKVRGRRLEDSSSYSSYNRVDTSDAYISMVMRSGFANEEYLQRYHELSRDFMGPVLTGEQIRDIVRCDFVLPDSIKLAKLLTGALLERLLNGKEIVSRRLYREYAQMRNAKIKARKEAAFAASAAQTAEVDRERSASNTSLGSASQASASNSSDFSLHGTPAHSLEVQIEQSAKAISASKKQLFFEAYPDKDNLSKDNQTHDATYESKPKDIPYISQFDYVHNCVPRDKHDAPEFLCEYLNLGSQTQSDSTYSSVNTQNSNSKHANSSHSNAKQHKDSQLPKYETSYNTTVQAAVSAATYISGAQDVSQKLYQPKETATASLVDADMATATTEDTSKTTKSQTPSSNGIVSASKVHAISSMDVSSGAQDECICNPSESPSLSSVEQPLNDDFSVESEKVLTCAISDMSNELSEPHNTESNVTAVATNKFVSKTNQLNYVEENARKSANEGEKIKEEGLTNAAKTESNRLEAAENNVAQKAALKAKADAKKEADKLKAAAKKEAEKLKAAEKRAAQKAALKAKADAKKEADKLKAAAKKEAEKLKAAEKMAAQKAALKAKADAKKEADKLKAAAKKEADKLKAAEKMAAQKAALKAKADAKKEATKLKAAARKEAEKLKAAEKRAAQRAKSAALKAANREKAKAKAKASAEAKEALIDREFAHSLLAMIDTGMKKRQRLKMQAALKDDGVV